jgi:putative transposon-encoded protein
MSEAMEVKVQAYQVIEKTVKTSGNSGRVYVPKEWVGKRVKVILLETISNRKAIKYVNRKNSF